MFAPIASIMHALATVDERWTGSALVTWKIGQCLSRIRLENEDFGRGYQVHLFEDER